MIILYHSKTIRITILSVKEILTTKCKASCRCLSGVTCVYYDLKSCIFAEVQVFLDYREAIRKLDVLKNQVPKHLIPYRYY